jgi:hypothetical protein
MKRLGIIAFILALVLCFAMPASAVKIFPYNMPLQDIVTWDRFDEEFRVANPENESITVAWPEDVDYWDYDGDQWKYNLPDGDEFLFKKGVNVGDENYIIVYTQGEPILEVWGTCAGTSGTVNAMPVYIMSILTGEGQVGRAAEFVLAPTCVRMGAWGNAIKAKLDLSGDGVTGSIGLLAGVCAEVVTPATALSGTLACVEHEIVATAGFLAGDVIGSANTINFMQFALGGDSGGVDEVDDHGQFMIINGLAAEAGHMLSLDYITLKCSINNLGKYLIFSILENTIQYTKNIENFSLVTGNLLGELIALRCNYDGTGTQPYVSASFQTFIQNGATVAPNVPMEAIFTNIEDLGATVLNAKIIFGVRMQGIIIADNYDRFCPFSLNTSNRMITALFDIASAASIGCQGGAGAGVAQCFVPLFVDPGGTVSYVKVWSATD